MSDDVENPFLTPDLHIDAQPFSCSSKPLFPTTAVKEFAVIVLPPALGVHRGVTLQHPQHSQGTNGLDRPDIGYAPGLVPMVSTTVRTLVGTAVFHGDL